jgi:hypothetical protein
MGAHSLGFIPLECQWDGLSVVLFKGTGPFSLDALI